MAKQEFTKDELVEIGQKAGELARQDILRICEGEGLTPQAVIQTILDGMGATSVKQQFVPPTTVTFGPKGDKTTLVVDAGGWVEAPPLIDHGARLSAVKLGKDILGLDAPKRLDSTVHHDFISPETADLVNKITSRAKVCITEGAQVTITQARKITASFREFSHDEDDVPIEIGGAAA